MVTNHVVHNVSTQFFSPTEAKGETSDSATSIFHLDAATYNFIVHALIDAQGFLLFFLEVTRNAWPCTLESERPSIKAKYLPCQNLRRPSVILASFSTGRAKSGRDKSRISQSGSAWMP